jgi:Amt family ammonium transporter
MRYGDFNAGVGTFCDLDSTEDTKELIRCIVSNADIGARQFARDVLLVFAAALIFFMQAGFAMLCAGCVRKKNVQNTMLKNLLDACGASIAYFLVGFAFSFGGMNTDSAEKTFIGKTNFFMKDVDDPAFWLFHYAFSAASATIVAGTLAERCQMVAYLCYSVVLTGWVYPIIVHAIWNSQGILSAFSVDPLWGVGMVDFAGSGVVHLTGGVTALFATSVLGPRRGRFHDEAGRRLAFPVEIPGHSAALQVSVDRTLTRFSIFLEFILTFQTYYTDAWNFYTMVRMVWIQ